MGIFLCGKRDDISPTSNVQFSPNLATSVHPCLLKYFWKWLLKCPVKGSFAPSPKKNKLKGINRYLTLIILHPRVCNAEMLFTHFCSPRAVEFQSRVTFLCDITVWTVVQTALTATSILMGIGKFQPPQTRYPWTVTTLIPNLVVAVRLREHLKDYEDHVHCTTYYVPWTA